MKDYVIIQSSIDIVVTAGLQNEDVTNPDAHVPDRLNVKPIWPKTRVQIYKGQHTYPSVITTWNSVKSLANSGILTIGMDVESADEKVVELKDDLERVLEKTKKSSKVKQVSDINLEDLSE